MEKLCAEIELDDKFNENMEMFRALFPDYSDGKIIKTALSLGARVIAMEQSKLNMAALNAKPQDHGIMIHSRPVRDVTFSEELDGFKWVVIENEETICGGGTTWEEAITDFKHSVDAHSECFAENARLGATIEEEDGTFTAWHEDCLGLFAAGNSLEELNKDFDSAARQWFICDVVLKKGTNEA